MRYLTPIVLIVLALTLACGGDDDDVVSDTPTSTSSPSETPTSGSPGLDTCPLTYTPGDDVVGHAEESPAAAVRDNSRIDCGVASRGSDIHRASVIVTDETPAAVLFRIEGRSLWCNELAGSALRVLPDATYLIEWFAKSGPAQTSAGGGTQGTTWCGKSPGAMTEQFSIKGRHSIEISTQDPVFGVTILGDQTIVKLLDGQLTVTIDGINTRLTAHKQISIAADGKYEIQEIELTADDKDAIAQIRNVTPLPDLTVAYSDSAYHTDPPSCTVYYRLRNLREVTAPEVVTRLELDGQVGEDTAENVDHEYEKLRSITVPVACPNFQEVSSFLVVDPDDVVAEKDEGNNTYPPTR